MYWVSFQELLQQYKLSQVAYAAVPHLVEIARQKPDTRLHLMVLVGGCHAHATDPGAPEIPVEFEDDWHSAAWEAPALTCELLAEKRLSENELRYLLASLAALHGRSQLSQVIEALDVEITCPQCGADLDPVQYYTGVS